MDTREKSGFGAWIHAWLMSRAGPRYDQLVRERKQRLFADLRGSILEVGPGTGVNVSYFAADTHWIGVEPNPHMSPHLARAISAARLRAEVKRGIAERLPAEAASQDAVVSTLVLCSVNDPQQALQEIVRVLKPGGRFVFLEHVAAAPGTRLRAVQRLLRPLSVRLGDGCHPDRETWKLIEAAGFSTVKIEHFRLPLGHVAPQIAGVAIR